MKKMQIWEILFACLISPMRFNRIPKPLTFSGPLEMSSKIVQPSRHKNKQSSRLDRDRLGKRKAELV